MPIYAGVETPVFISILYAVDTLARLKPDCTITFYHTERKPLWKARQILWDMARYSKADRMVFLGEDIVIQPDTLIKHAEAKYDIYSALYFEREAPYRPMVFKLDNNLIWTAGEIKIDKEVKVVEGVGLDCCSISRNVLNRLTSNVFVPYHQATGDDLSFCLRVKQAGFNIYVDTNHIVGHVEQKKRIISLKDHVTGIKMLKEKTRWVKEKT